MGEDEDESEVKKIEEIPLTIRMLINLMKSGPEGIEKATGLLNILWLNRNKKESREFVFKWIDYMVQVGGSCGDMKELRAAQIIDSIVRTIHLNICFRCEEGESK